MSSAPGPGSSALTTHLRNAIESADWPSLARAMHPNVSWGAPDGAGSGCRGRTDVLGRSTRLHADGLHVTVDEAFTYPAAVVLGLRTQSTGPTPAPQTTVYQVYDIADGLITRITAYTGRSEALEAAYTRATAELRSYAGFSPASPNQQAGLGSCLQR